MHNTFSGIVSFLTIKKRKPLVVDWIYDRVRQIKEIMFIVLLCKSSPDDKYKLRTIQSSQLDNF